MGANQSSSRGGRAENENNSEVAGERNYYDLLGVDSKALDEEIKKAYRKKALELHPDRNYGNVEESTRLFAEVQSAYEVLSDPHERAWYDSHQDVITSEDLDRDQSQDGNALKATTVRDVMSIFRNLHGCTDFSDSAGGFYSILRRAFEQLAKEEEFSKAVDDRMVDYPSFGFANDSYEDNIKEFYAAWSNFSTRKSFSWRDRYRYHDASDRQMRRLMEKENKRLREEGMREFNDTVRSLVLFVKKRDPRFTPNTQSELERQKVLRDLSAAQSARSRAANEAKMNDVVPEWAKAVEPNTEGEEDEEEETMESFECVVCNKNFKSEKQYESHEKSKKHKKAVYQLRKVMRAEDLDFKLEKSGSNAGSEDEVAHFNMGGIPPDEPSALGSALQTESQVDEESEKDKAIPLAQEVKESASDIEEQNPQSSKQSSAKGGRRRRQNAAQKPVEFRCAVCRAEYPSKTKLFRHIKELNHAVPVPKGKK